MMGAMGVLYDYFAAASDDEAAAAIDRIGGPGSPTALAPPAAELGPGWLRGKPSTPRPQFVTDPELPVYDTVAVKGVDPMVQLGTLEELLTGRPYAEIEQDPRSGRIIATRDSGPRLVVGLSDSLVQGLISATREQLAAVAAPWLQTEEFSGQGDPAAAADFLNDLAGLARQAQQRGHRLYCWVSV
jgi:hypothetical protein